MGWGERAQGGASMLLGVASMKRGGFNPNEWANPITIRDKLITTHGPEIVLNENRGTGASLVYENGNIPRVEVGPNATHETVARHVKTANDFRKGLTLEGRVASLFRGNQPPPNSEGAVARTDIKKLTDTIGSNDARLRDPNLSTEEATRLSYENDQYRLEIEKLLEKADSTAPAANGSTINAPNSAINEAAKVIGGDAQATAKLIENLPNGMGGHYTWGLVGETPVAVPRAGYNNPADTGGRLPLYGLRQNEHGQWHLEELRAGFDTQGAYRGSIPRDTSHFFQSVTVDTVQNVPTFPGRDPGHAFGSNVDGRKAHNVSKKDVISILNDPDRVFSGINRNGNSVDIYWKNGSVVITDAGNKNSVISAYGRIDPAQCKAIDVDRWMPVRWG